MALTDLKSISSGKTLPSVLKCNDMGDQEAFKDNLEHLEALEYISRLKLARAYLLGGKPIQQSPGRRRSHQFQKSEELYEPSAIQFPEISAGEVTLDEIETSLNRLETTTREKVKRSLEQGVELHFEEFCRSYELDTFEQTVLALLVANNTGKAFRNFYEKSEFDPHDREDGGMSVGAILSIIHPDYREQVTGRKYFSIDASLIKQEIVIPWGHYDNTTNILDVYLHLHERIVRYLIGDNNIYDMDLHCISRDRKTVNPDQVILPEGTKEKVLKLAKNYSANKSRTGKALVDEFYGYGTGLIFLFHGLSGTGKTMLAHALATSLDKELLSVNIEHASNLGASSEDLIKYLFKEAKLSDGIVFFDECDEIFHAGSRDSRTLLIEIEKSDCITIMATNRVIELDPALDRRITMKVPFFLPDENQRERIWKALVPPNVSLNKDINFKSLAEKYIFSGGLIKNTMFAAITNAMSTNGRSKVRLNTRDIEEAAKWQTASMFDLNSFGRSYLPKSSIQSLPIGSLDRQKIEKLANACIHLNGKPPGLRMLLGCSDIETGTRIVDAVARECNIRVREFHVPDLFRGTYNTRKIIDPMSRQEVDPLDYAFSTGTGHRALTLLVDHDTYFERLLLKETTEGNSGNDLLGFYRKLKEFKGLLFLVTNPVKTHSLPIEFNRYLEVHPPPEELQIRKWEKHLGDDKDIQQRLVDMVEQYPLHLNEISEIIQGAKTTALMNGNDFITFEDVHETLKRFKGRKSVPILFGKGAGHG
jgi:DNA polymerase III delta prime subunit